MSETQQRTFTSEVEETRRKVREGYTAVVEGRGSLNVVDAGSQARSFGYDTTDLESAPAAANLGLGCGNPTDRAGIRPGETVLDLWCGVGLDAFIASRAVGPTGHVIGVDMTPALIEEAQTAARNDHYTNVEFRVGTMESLTVVDASVDAVLSNCAINLSPEKDRVFAEVKAGVEAYIGGATTKEQYADLVDAPDSPT